MGNVVLDGNSVSLGAAKTAKEPTSFSVVRQTRSARSLVTVHCTCLPVCHPLPSSLVAYRAGKLVVCPPAGPVRECVNSGKRYRVFKDSDAVRRGNNFHVLCLARCSTCSGPGSPQLSALTTWGWVGSGCWTATIAGDCSSSVQPDV